VSTIGVGLVGLSAGGSWASRAHLPALRAIDGYEVRGACASSAASAAAAAREYDVPLAFGDVGEMARHPDIDLVVVSVKAPHHLALLTPVIEADKMAFSEWPLGNGLAESEELAALADARGLRTVVGLQAQSSPVIRYLRDLVADGYVGELLSTTLTLSGRSLGSGQVASVSRYLVDPGNGATLLTITGAHALDAFATVVGEFAEISAVTATRRPQVRVRETGEMLATRAPDQIAVSGRLAGGAVAGVHIRGGTSRGSNFNWEINGTEGDLVVSSPSGLMQFATVRGARGEETELADLGIPAAYHHVPGLAGQEDGLAYAVAHGYVQLLTDLAEGTTLTPDFDYAVRRHRTLDAIERAAATGHRQLLTA
jgi:predicted dehydrogenase